MPPPVDYDSIAPAYDRRYDVQGYPGIRRSLLAHVGEGRPWRVLEVGCGTGFWIGVLREAGCTVSGLDASAEMLSVARSRLGGDVDLRRGRAESLPWSDATFHQVNVVNAVHHFADPARAIGEACRILEPGGVLVVIGLDPHAGRDRWYVYDWFAGTEASDRQRYPPATRIRRWMSDAGLTGCETVEAEHLVGELGARDALASGHLERSFTSQLSLLPEEAFAAGRRRILDELAAAEAAGRGLALRVDLRLWETRGFKGSET